MYIYLIKDIKSEVYKIGYSKNVNKRIKQLETANSGKLLLVDSFKTQHNRKVETVLHNIYKNKNINGEWFNLSSEDINSFQNKCSEIENNINNLKQYNNPFI